MKDLKYLISVELFFIIFSFQGFSQTSKSWQPSPSAIEKSINDKKDFNFYEDKVPQFTLPEVLTSNTGKKITKSTEWYKIRRPKVIELLTDNLYGRIPVNSYCETFKVVNQDDSAMNGKATLKQIDISISAQEKLLIIHLVLFTPANVKKPVPTFLFINNREPFNIDPTRKQKSQFWPAEEVISRGYGIAAFNFSDVTPDYADAFKNGIFGLLDQNPREENAWGKIAAWAWGASRCMDYLITDKNVAKNKIAVVGHSRGGKTALWAGATDTRFAITISNDAGCLGTSIVRRRYGETISRINKVFPYWFCENMKKYDNLEDKMPFDMHFLLSLIAPRALYVACASDDLWADPRGSYLAVCNSTPVYKLLGEKSDLPEKLPPVDKQIISGKIGFHIRSGGHDLLLSDWINFICFADVIFKNHSN